MSLTSIFAWRQVKKASISTSISKNGFMCFAGIAKPESHTLQQIEKDIKINRELDLQRLVPCFIRVRTYAIVAKTLDSSLRTRL